MLDARGSFPRAVRPSAGAAAVGGRGKGGGRANAAGMDIAEPLAEGRYSVWDAIRRVWRPRAATTARVDDAYRLPLLALDPGLTSHVVCAKVAGSEERLPAAPAAAATLAPYEYRRSLAAAAGTKAAASATSAVHETVIGSHRYKTDAGTGRIKWHEAWAQCQSWGMDLAYIPGGRGCKPGPSPRTGTVPRLRAT